jgi:hypothetical protein
LLWEAVEKTPSSLLPSTAASVDNTAIGAIGSIPLPLPSTTTAIAAVNDRHCCCHTVNNDNPQKPVVVVCHQRRQLRSLLTEVVVDGGCRDGGLCQWRLSSTEAAVGWRDNDAMASAAMVSSADGGSNDGSRCRQLAVDAAATIPLLVSMVAAKTPLPPPSSTTASINADCYCHC